MYDDFEPDFEPDYVDDFFDEPEEDDRPVGAFIGGEWVDVEDLPAGYGRSPDWWDDDTFGETYEEFCEHED